MGDYTDFTAEIASHLGGMTQILNNLQRIIDDLPDKRDSSDIVKSLSKIKGDLEIILNSVVKEDTEINRCRLKCSQMVTTVDAINSVLVDVNKDDIVEVVSKLKEWNTSKSNELFKEIADAHIKWGDTPVKWEDLKEVVDYAKRRNKTYEFWKGWKSKTAIVSAIVGVILLYFDKILNVIKALKAMFSGGG